MNKPHIPTVIDHSNMQPLLRAIEAEPYFQCGSKRVYDPDEWFWQTVSLEVPTGELAKDGLTTMALAGRRECKTAALDGKEGFNAQGLEGKVVIRKDLFGALMNLRDLIPISRGRIVTR